MLEIFHSNRVFIHWIRLSLHSPSMEERPMEHPSASDASYVLRFPHGLLRGTETFDRLANQKQWHSRRCSVSQIDNCLCGHGRCIMQVLILDKGAELRRAKYACSSRMSVRIRTDWVILAIQ